MKTINRRHVGARKIGLFHTAAKKLVAVGITANQISLFSIVFAVIGSVGLYGVTTSSETVDVVITGFVALIGIQGRLISNLLDGLVAIEGGKKTPVGDLFNEVPDRISDTVLLCTVGLGLGKVGFSFGPMLGMAASLLALSTAYVRVLGGSLSLKQSFRGPMAKQHRMALLNIGVILSLIEFVVLGKVILTMSTILYTIAIGSGVTAGLRLRDIARALRAGGQ